MSHPVFKLKKFFKLDNSYKNFNYIAIAYKVVPNNVISINGININNIPTLSKTSGPPQNIIYYDIIEQGTPSKINLIALNIKEIMERLDLVVQAMSCKIQHNNGETIFINFASIKNNGEISFKNDLGGIRNTDCNLEIVINLTGINDPLLPKLENVKLFGSSDLFFCPNNVFVTTVGDILPNYN